MGKNEKIELLKKEIECLVKSIKYLKEENEKCEILGEDGIIEWNNNAIEKRTKKIGKYTIMLSELESDSNE
jgi:hypothetical protein